MLRDPVLGRYADGPHTDAGQKGYLGIAPSLNASSLTCTNRDLPCVSVLNRALLRATAKRSPTHGLGAPSEGPGHAVSSVEDFTEFEQRAAYFDGGPVIATKKGVNILDRGSQVLFMAEFQALLDFPPVPKLRISGKLAAKQATEAETRGQDLFFGKAECGSCHPAPFYTDNSMHNMRAERFFKPRMINGRMASADGPIKTFTLRGIKDSPPYLHDGKAIDSRGYCGVL